MPIFPWFQSSKDSDGESRLQARLLDMLADGQRMFGSTVSILTSGGDPESIRETIYETDRRINEDEQLLRRELVVHGVAHGTSSLPMLLVLMSLAKDAERIGDYAKNVLDLARHRGRLTDQDAATVALLGGEASDLLQRGAALFKDQDEDGARAFLEEEAAFRRRCDDRIEEWIEDETSNRAVACLCVRYAKRVAGHAGNVVSSVCMPLDKLDFHPGSGGGDED